MVAMETFLIVLSAWRKLCYMCIEILRHAGPGSGGGVPANAAHRDVLLQHVQQDSMLLAVSMISKVRLMGRVGVHFCRRV